MLRNPVTRVIVSVIVLAPFLAVSSDLSNSRSAVAAIIVTVLLVVAGYSVYYLVVPRWLERRKRPAELDPAGAVVAVPAGLALGSAGFLAVLGVVAIGGGVRWDAGLPLGRAVLLGLAGALAAAAFEEIVFRGVLFRIIEQYLGSWITLVVSAVFFGAAHLGRSDATWWSAVAIAVSAGVSLGAMYMATRQLWLPIGTHLAWNFTQGFVGTPQAGIPPIGYWQAHLSGPRWLTGGPFGIEESVASMALWSAIAVVFLVIAVRRGRVVPPRWSTTVAGQDTESITEQASTG